MKTSPFTQQTQRRYEQPDHRKKKTKEKWCETQQKTANKNKHMKPN